MTPLFLTEPFATSAILLLAFVTFSRLGELLLAKRNTAALLQQGAVEVAPEHYPLIVAMHTAWLVTLWIYGCTIPVNPGWLFAFAILQAGRIWVLSTLGKRWTTRILVLPGETLVARGPYRFIRHPNYAVVIGEIAVLPLCFGLVWVAAIFTVLNAFVLFIRIRAENQALRQSRI